METTLISPQAVRELLLASGWTEHPEHRVFTQCLDLELSAKFWDSDRPLWSDDTKFDRLAREMGIPRDTLIEDLQQRTQRLLDEILDPPKAPKINSEKIIWPEALNIWMENRGWAFDPNELCYTCGYRKFPALNVPRPASDPYFLKLAINVGTPHAELVDALWELTQEFLKKTPMVAGPEVTPQINSEKLFDPEVLWTEEPVRHVPDSHVETVVSALRNGIEYARIALKNLPAKALSSSRLEKHVTSLMEADIREMERALELLGVKE